jgi:hypothetical protein
MPLGGSPAIRPAASSALGVASCFFGLFLLVALEGTLLALTSRRRSSQIGPSGKIPIVFRSA